MKLSEQQMIDAMTDHKVFKGLSQDEQTQVMNFAFGEEFMASEDKGSLKQYAED